MTVSPATTPVPALAARTGNGTSSPVRDLLALTARPGVISFAGGLPAPELFDLAPLRAAFDSALSGVDARRNLQYSPTEGDPQLRELIARRTDRLGLATAAAELLITTGSQQALTLIAMALLDPGAVVLVEEPTYLSALQCFQLAGARLVPVRGDDHGIDPDALAEIAARERPTLLYLVPNFANPTGRTLTGERRRQVAELAARHGFWIVEDDPYGELRYQGDPESPVATQATAGDRTLYLGSFSKVGAPGLRLGWLRASEPMIRSLAIVKQSVDLHTSTLDQAAVARYLADNDLDAHVRTLCVAYRVRRDAMLTALSDATPPGSRWTEPAGGMFIWVRLPGGVDTARLLPAALAEDVAFVPGAAFHAGEPDRATLRLSFTTYPPAQIAEGMSRLARALLNMP
jgi:DNA-binding transcriptional MocR family regulator